MIGNKKIYQKKFIFIKKNISLRIHSLSHSILLHTLISLFADIVIRFVNLTLSSVAQWNEPVAYNEKWSLSSSFFSSLNKNGEKKSSTET